MDILVSGSMAYDRVMDFPGRFSDHIMPDKLDKINVSFTVNGLKENLGGTAGNIAYVLSLLGESPRILAAMGHDYHQYFQWLEKNGIGTGDIRIIPEELTASAYITTDEGDNQITGFNPGAMKHPSLCDLTNANPAECLAIVAPTWFYSCFRASPSADATTPAGTATTPSPIIKTKNVNIRPTTVIG